MDFQLGQNLLGVVPSSVAADSEVLGYGQVGAALGQQLGHLSLSPGQSETFAKVTIGACPVRLRQVLILGSQPSPELAQHIIVPRI
jgi:hypothetical protein